MDQGKPSRTALGAASHRAAHQVLEHGSIFSDSLATRILGADLEMALHKAQHDPSLRKMRLFIAVRTRFAEDALAASFERGVCQVVVLGAGLDTYAYRASLPDGVRVFEVDHPATQAWKRQRLAEAAIEIPKQLTFAPIDFECETLVDGLTSAGFDPAHQTFFTWLGVVPYLTEQAVFSTLAFIAGCRGSAYVVFDYANPANLGADPDERTLAHEELAARVASVGEAFKCFLETDALHSRLINMGFAEIEDLGPTLIRQRYFFNRGAASGDRGGHILRARTPGPR